MKGSSDPIWRETLFLYVRDSETQSLTVHVEHAAREPENTNVLLGYAEIKDLKKLCDGEVHNLQLDLQGWVHACLHFASKAAAIPAGDANVQRYPSFAVASRLAQCIGC